MIKGIISSFKGSSSMTCLNRSRSLQVWPPFEFIAVFFRFSSRYNGSLPSGDRGRRKSRFALYRRAKANGVKPSAVHILNTPQDSKVRVCMRAQCLFYLCAISASFLWPSCFSFVTKATGCMTNVMTATSVLVSVCSNVLVCLEPHLIQWRQMTSLENPIQIGLMC